MKVRPQRNSGDWIQPLLVCSSISAPRKAPTTPPMIEAQGSDLLPTSE